MTLFIFVVAAIFVELKWHPRFDMLDKKIVMWYGNLYRNYITLLEW
jgi:hypothetical protein